MVRHVVRTGSGSALLAMLVLVVSLQTHAQTQPQTGPAWTELSASERQALQPLQTQWDSIDHQRKQKWRDVAARYPSLPAVQQTRLHERMVEWTTLTPAQRNTARVGFEDLRKLPATERQTRWDAYQNLPADQRQALSTQANSRPLAAPAPQAAAVRKTPAMDSLEAKSNIVTTPQATARPQSAAPGTVQAGVGASTRPISKPPTPPRHQQAGLPKIAATPEFVQSETLLPQRGPQGVGAGPATRPDTP